ncbi:hypothetical protein [Aliidiomarina minuta]|nr:hypothetical protein [Aliidiomarina minuta]
MLDSIASKAAASSSQQPTENERITFSSTEPPAVQELRNPNRTAGETFLEEAERLTLLARMGVDLETLERIEEEIEDLESLETLNDEQQEELASLLEQRAELFREASERQNGEQLPPGSMLSIRA